MLAVINLLVNVMLFAPRLFMWGWCVISSFDLKSIKGFTVMQGWTNVLLILEYIALIYIMDYFVLTNYLIPIVDIVFSCLICFITWRTIDEDRYGDYKSPDRSLHAPLINASQRMT